MSTSLCLFVLCPGAYLRNYTSDLCVDPSLGPPVAGVGLVALQTCDTLCTSGLWMTSYLHMMGHVGPESGLPVVSIDRSIDTAAANDVIASSCAGYSVVICCVVS